MEAKSCFLCGGLASSFSLRFRHNAVPAPPLSCLFNQKLIRNDAATKRRGGGVRSNRKSKKLDILRSNSAEAFPAAKSVRGLNENGDPLGRRELGKSVVGWIREGMKAMASDFALAEAQGEFPELRQRMGPGLTFVIQAQPYLNVVPMPLGLEALCLKAGTHYPTLFDHFQRELRDVLQDLQQKSLVQNWSETESWKLLKELASSGLPPSLPLFSNFYT
jgi:hypothetical protein